MISDAILWISESMFLYAVSLDSKMAVHTHIYILTMLHRRRARPSSSYRLEPGPPHPPTTTGARLRLAESSWLPQDPSEVSIAGSIARGAQQRVLWGHCQGGLSRTQARRLSRGRYCCDLIAGSCSEVTAPPPAGCRLLPSFAE